MLRGLGRLTHYGKSKGHIVSSEGSIQMVRASRQVFDPATSVERTFQITPAAALAPTFGTVTRRASGISVSVSNHSADWQWEVSSDEGTAAIDHTGSITVTGLNAGQAATVTVKTTRANYADGSETVTGQALDRPATPGSPTGAAGNGQVALSWAAPSDNGGSAITGHKVQAKPATGGDWADATDTDANTTDMHAVIKNLTNGTGYVFRIAAVNAIGQSEWSADTATVTPKGTQTINFVGPGNKVFASGDVALNATATSGLPVGLVSSTTDVCRVSNGSATLLATGTCKITASQGGNDAFDPAASVERTFQVTLAAALTPTLGAVTRTADGFNVPVSNHSADWQWRVSSDKGTAAIDNTGLITVTGLNAGQAATVKLHAEDLQGRPGQAEADRQEGRVPPDRYRRGHRPAPQPAPGLRDPGAVGNSTQAGVRLVAAGPVGWRAVIQPGTGGSSGRNTGARPALRLIFNRLGDLGYRTGIPANLGLAHGRRLGQLNGREPPGEVRRIPLVQRARVAAIESGTASRRRDRQTGEPADPANPRARFGIAGRQHRVERLMEGDDRVRSQALEETHDRLCLRFGRGTGSGIGAILRQASPPGGEVPVQVNRSSVHPSTPRLAVRINRADRPDGEIADTREASLPQ